MIHLDNLKSCLNKICVNGYLTSYNLSKESIFSYKTEVIWSFESFLYL